MLKKSSGQQVGVAHHLLHFTLVFGLLNSLTRCTSAAVIPVELLFDAVSSFSDAFSSLLFDAVSSFSDAFSSFSMSSRIIVESVLRSQAKITCLHHGHQSDIALLQDNFSTLLSDIVAVIFAIFALQSLSEKSFKQFFKHLANSWNSVSTHRESVWKARLVSTLSYVHPQ